MKRVTYIPIFLLSSYLLLGAGSAFANSSCVAYFEEAVVPKKATVVALEDAQPEQLEPARVVEKVTTSLITYVRDQNELYSNDPSQYFVGIKDILNPAVDFLRIAKNVMGKKNWFSVSEEEQTQFVTSFNDYLVRFYGKNLQPYIDSEIDIESACTSSDGRSMYVQQRVKTNSGVNRLVYTMRRVGEVWMLSNVQFNGVNMGQTFRAQFQQLVDDNGGDVAVAVQKWAQQQS